VAKLMEAELNQVLRRERARVVAGLYRSCGSLDAAEDAFAEALVTAVAQWPKTGVPDNPGAWVTQVAKNHLKMAHRHRAVAEDKAVLLKEDEVVEARGVEAVSDDQLRLVFTCCHPSLTQESQVALTLKVIAGFTVEELGRAFLVPEPTMAQRLVRAKRQIDEEHLQVAVPGRRDLSERLAAVLAVVYLVFNEGHTASGGALMRLELQGEALRLGRLLAELLPTEAEVFGLHALMAFSAARAATRADPQGVLLLLSEQDRSKWDRALIIEGLVALQRARRLGGGAYTLQAEISACHATAPTWEATGWPRILAAYDALLELTKSPVVAMNRAVAVMMIDGPKAGLAALAPLAGALERYHLFYATRADFLRRAGEDARADDEKALKLATNEGERAFLKRRLALEP
jgi:RNA polymerase sigma-70 factor (ECF subfamily)